MKIDKIYSTQDKKKLRKVGINFWALLVKVVGSSRLIGMLFSIRIMETLGF